MTAPRRSFVYERNLRNADLRDRMDVGQVASRLRVSNSTVYRLIRSGTLKAARFGPARGLQVYTASVEEYERAKQEEAGII